jgi:CDP-diacylglycerol--serine O-phosphatidyltransferase
LGGVFDFFDGLVARLLKAYSEIGKQLDSLADFVTFGIAPSVLMYHLMETTLKLQDATFSFDHASLGQKILLFSSFLIAIFSALRLAKFNIDPRQSNSFIGVPTPANAFFIASLVLLLFHQPALSVLFLNVWFLLPLYLILSFLLVAELPMISLKFKNLKFADNKERYLLVIVSALILIFFRLDAYPLIFIAYLIISVGTFKFSGQSKSLSE